MQATKHTSIATLIIACAMMTIAAMPVSAQGTAEVWIDQAAEKLRNKGAELTFRINEDGAHVSGKLLMDGEKFVYDTEDMKIWYDGTTQWTLQFSVGYSELYINNPTMEEQQSINPYMLLNSYQDYYTITDRGEKVLNGKPVHMVTLKDKGAAAPNSINIYIHNDRSLALIEFNASDDRSYKIEVRSMRNGLTFPKGTFTYQPEVYPADEVIDMR